ncbi:MAG: ribosome silencing factor [Candidatus Omnitrophota bacterium]|nr:ribosome silencing factor [Candidatus Omnitrophota bacterium]
MEVIDSGEKSLICARACRDKKGENILLIDLKKISNFTDFFVICDGQSDRHLKAIADNILGELKHFNIRVWHIDGYREGRWILLDYNDVIVHIFCKELRSFYDLERLWSKAPRSAL